jgi:thioredoxin reductase (NADPH)
VAVFDCGRPGRSDWSQVNHNYLGFPDGISAVELGAHGRRQAERFGARMYQAEVAYLVQEEDLFRVTAPNCTVHARAVVLATGVSDRWVQFPGYEDFIGRTLHWCIVCDGYEMRDQRVLVVGNDDHIADLAVQMLTFAKEVTLVTNSGSLGIPPDAVHELDERGIRVVVGRITGATAKAKGAFKAVQIEGGDEIKLDHMFSHQGSDPNNALARALGLDLTADGFIEIDTEGRTSLSYVYAAGDVTSLFGHQVATAVHEGATAANAVNYDLFQRDKRAFAAGRRKMDDRL